MTLIAVAGNSKYMIQVMDRRLTVNGSIAEEESCKNGTLITNDAKLAFGYTGLASVGGFSSRNWILDTLNICGPPDYIAGNILNRFVNRANESFYDQPGISSLPDHAKWLTIVFSGYLYSHTPPLGVYAIVSNQMDNPTGTETGSHQKFSVSFKEERRPNDGNFAIAFYAGFREAIVSDDWALVKRKCQEGLPSNRIIDILVAQVRKIAIRPDSKDMIGQQLLSICISSESGKSVETDYHSAVSKHIVYMPDYVFLTSSGTGMAKDISVQAVDPETTPPMVFPNVGRNVPCPCGSGEKYKRCHGNK